MKLIHVARKSGSKVWIARWTDPDTGERRERSLDDLGLKNQEARRAWALDLYTSVTRRRAEIASGATAIRTQTPIETAVEGFITARTPEVRPATVVAYRKVAPKFVRWASVAGVQHTEDLTAPDLVKFRTWFLHQPRLGPAKGGRSGEKVATTSKRAPNGVNSDLCTIRAMLTEWRRTGLIPRITSDAIKDGTRRMMASRPLPEFLTTARIRDLLVAVRRHDSAVHEMTRREKAAGTSGTSPRHPPVAPLVVFLLLSGCRIGEALTLPWSAVDFEADAGRGQVTLSTTATKTRTARAIDLSMTPMLRQLLMLMKLKAGAQPFVFGGNFPLPRHAADNARKRLSAEYAAPHFTWQNLRQTTGTYLTNAPGIYGAAAAFRSAKRLGHSVVIAEKHYVGLVNVDPNAKTLEAAMGVAAEIEALVKHGFRDQAEGIAG